MVYRFRRKNDDSRRMTLHDVVGQLVPAEGILRAEQVHDNHVVRSQHVDRRLVAGRPPLAAGFRVRLVDLRDVGSGRHVLEGKGPPHEDPLGTQDLPPGFELISVAVSGK